MVLKTPSSRFVLSTSQMMTNPEINVKSSVLTVAVGDLLTADRSVSIHSAAGVVHACPVWQGDIWRRKQKQYE